MKYIKKLLIIVLILSINNAYASENMKICTPSEAYKKYMKLSDEEKSKVIAPNYCSDITKTKDTSSAYKFSFKIKAATASDEYYNALDDNLLTPVKNQYQLGTCWAFSAISAVESNALKNNLALYDFSEAHMVYSLVSGAYKDEDGKKGRYYTENMDGGKLTYAPSYYFNGGGQLLETELPYDEFTTTINSSNYIEGRKIITLKEFEYDNLSNTNAACTTDAISSIKTKILKYGSVQATMYMDQINNFKDSAENYYLATDADGITEDDYPNHGILIVGWDDTISKYLFNGATRNGAWIIKNSWGSDWSGDGYFYISYDDQFICNGTAAFSGVSTTTYDNTYKSADLIGDLYLLFQNKRYFTTKFTKQSEADEKIKRVSFSVGNFSSYNVYLSKSNDYEDNSDWILLGSGSSSTFGVKSIDIDDDIEITDDFTIIVEYTIDSGKQTSFFTMCDISDDTALLDYSTGVNYTSYDGVNWTDFGTVNIGDGNIYHCEPNIWVNTDHSLPDPVVGLDNPVVVKNKVTLDLIYENINVDSIVYTITDTDNVDVTSHFIITPNYLTKKIVLESDNTLSGVFTLNIEYGAVGASIQFRLVQIIIAEDKDTMTQVYDDIKVSITNGTTFTYKDLTDNLSNSIEVEVYNSNGTKVEDNSSALGTGSIVKVGTVEYTIVVIGDSTGDGTINSADLLKMVRHLKGTSNLSDAQRLAGDCTKDGTINSADLLKVVRYLKGITTMGI